MKRGERVQGSVRINWADAVRTGLKGGVLAAIITLLMLALSSFAVAAGLGPVEYMWPMLLVGCVVGSFAAGILARKRVDEPNVLLGIGIGFVEFLIFLIAGLLVHGTNGDWGRGTVILLSCVCGGVLSGLNLKKGTKKRRKNKGTDRARR